MLEELLETWFGPLDEYGLCIENRGRFWFQSTAEEDTDLKRRFLPLFEAASAGKYDESAETARGRLGMILVFDQLPRNFFRATARAFATDLRAQQHCVAALAAGQDRELARIEQAFLLMPLMHAEDLGLQDQSVDAFEKLVANTPAAQRQRVVAFAQHAHEHRDLIARFGRFPHRNQSLGRKSTPAEMAYLADGGQTYGQQ